MVATLGATARDLQVHRGVAGPETVFVQQALRDLGQADPLEPAGKLYAESLEPAGQPARMPLPLEQLPVHGAGDFIHAVPEQKAAVVHRDGGACALERSEEHTSELQSRLHLVCRLLLEKKKNQSSTA